MKTLVAVTLALATIAGPAIGGLIYVVSPTLVYAICCALFLGASVLISMIKVERVAPKRENRFCLPNTRFLLHQPSGGIFGAALDIAIQAEQIVKMRERLNQIFAEATGQPIERIEKDTHRDFWMTPKEAIEYGLLGSVIKSELELA